MKQVHAANGVIYQINRIMGMKSYGLILNNIMLQNNPDSIINDYVTYLETRTCKKVFTTDIGRYFVKVSFPKCRLIRELNLSRSVMVYKKISKTGMFELIS